MLSVDEYRAEILNGIEPLPPIQLPLPDAPGCVLAEDVQAPWPLPSFDNSSMDGYAVLFADIAQASQASPVALTVVDDVPAGYRATESVRAGHAIRIMTGAPMPEGADTVVPVERTDGGTEVVHITSPADKGAFIRKAGEDVVMGDTVLRAGTLITARQIALLASVGQASILVHPRPRVAVLSTGSELVEPGAPLKPGLIVDSNSYMLATLVEEAGAVAYRTGAVVDDEEAFMKAIEDQLHRVDLIITSGGVSMGAYDTVKAVLSRLGTVSFQKIKMNPGMPQGHGFVGDGPTPIVTLPGNPVSSYVSFENFIRPVIRRMQGREKQIRDVIDMVCTKGFTSPAGKTQFARGRFVGPNRVEPVGTLQGSHVVGGLGQSDCLIVIPEDQTDVPIGSTVQVMDLRGNE
jgi:molybdopterin molybdotransferase